MTRDVDAQVQRLTRAFAAELVPLIKRAALESVAAALDERLERSTHGSAKRAPRVATVEIQPTRAPRPAANGSRPLSYRAYEREALLRALSEGGGSTPKAIELLGLTKSSFYRHLSKAGIDSRNPEKPLGFANDLPLSQDAYERDLLERSIAAHGGDMLRTAKALRVGKSTLYRRASYLGVGES
jgi:DNA-binding NtrC family response regulator